MAELYDQENQPAEGPETAGKAHEEMVEDFNKPGLGEVSDLDEVRKQKEAGNAAPLKGGIKEYDPEKAPSEKRMREMEAAKKDYKEQKPFDDYAKSADADKEREKIGWLRKILGGK